MRNVSSSPAPQQGPRRWGTLVNSLVVMLGYILSRMLGIVRDLTFSHQFGVTDAADAYRAAFKVPDLLYLVVIGGALGSAFIPVFSELLGRDGERRAWRLASQVLNVALIMLLAISLLVALLADPLTALLYPDFSPAKQALIADLTRLFLLSPLLLGLGGLAMAALNALDRYTLPALAPSIYNLSIIAGIVFLSPRWGVHGAAYGVVLGALLYLFIQLPGLVRAGMRYTPSLGLRDRSLRRVGWLMAPRVFGQSALQINLIVMASIASSLGEGRVAALDQAYQLMLLPHGIFALSLGTVAFPAMARAFNAGDIAQVGQAMRTMLRLVLWTVMPAAVALAVLRVPLVRLLFQHGAFDHGSTWLVSSALLLYATALPAFAASEILIRTFYAMQNTRTPVLVGVLVVLFNLVLAWGLVHGLGYGHVALAAAFSVANNLEVLLLLVLLHRWLGRLDPAAELRRSLQRTLVAALGMGLLLLALLLLSQSLMPWLSAEQTGYQASRHAPLLLLWLGLAGLLGLGGYLGLAALQGAEELQLVAGRLLRRLRR